MKRDLHTWRTLLGWHVGERMCVNHLRTCLKCERTEFQFMMDEYATNTLGDPYDRTVVLKEGECRET